MNIITISREFGSGGRELGKRLADTLGFAYYDREIITAVAQKSEFDEQYIERTLESELFRSYPVSFGRTFSCPASTWQNTTKILVAQQQIVKELAAKDNCVIVGRGADIILRKEHPFKLFVYADMPSKIQRCLKRAKPGEQLTERELQKKIKQVDAERIKFHELLSNLKWGDKQGYHLCINTTGISLKELTPYVAAYINHWMGGPII